MNRMIKKKIYKVTFKLESPLSIGSGNNNQTDRDIIKNSMGIPYIPGSALAGIGRETTRAVFKKIDVEQLENKYFGDIAKNEKEQNRSSRIVFYDGRIVGDTYYISNRDSVELDEWKTAIKGHKFDMEILEPGIRIETYIEQNYYDDEEQDIFNDILKFWLNNTIYMGTKTMRGYGSLNTEQVLMKEFNLTDESSVEEWLDFDMYSDLWDDAVEVSGNDSEMHDRVELKLRLKQVGGIFIRRYTTKVADERNTSVPDYEQLTVRVGDKELPTIPGTSWAGTFRHRMIALNKSCDSEELWGTANAENKCKSSIRFSETILHGAKAKQISRNSIDRFSGGTTDSALFTEKTYYGGETELVISVDKRVDVSIKNTLAAAIADLHYGFLAVGGLTSVGRGLFKIQSVNGLAVTENVYKDVINALNVPKMEV